MAVRFYFHLRDHEHRLIPDGEGSDLPDHAAAVEEAKSSARELAGNAIREGRQPIQRIEVMDAAGVLLFVYPVRDVMR